MHVIFYSADLQRRAFKLFGNGTQVRMQRFPKDFVAQQRPALFGREDEMNVNRRKRLWHGVVPVNGATPSELSRRRDVTQGSSMLATLGWGAESLQDSPPRPRRRLSRSVKGTART